MKSRWRVVVGSGSRYRGDLLSRITARVYGGEGRGWSPQGHQGARTWSPRDHHLQLQPVLNQPPSLISFPQLHCVDDTDPQEESSEVMSNDFVL